MTKYSIYNAEQRHGFASEDNDHIVISGNTLEQFSSEKCIHFDVPRGVEEISEFAFNNCPSLETITIPDSVCIIKSTAFIRCPNLEDIFVSGDNEDYLHYKGVLYDNKGARLIAFPQNWNHKRARTRDKFIIDEDVTEIADYAFYGSSLRHIVVSKNISKIGDHAFEGCDNLRWLEIPTINDVEFGKVIVEPSYAFETTRNLYNTIGPSFGKYYHDYNKLDYYSLVNILGYYGSSVQSWAQENNLSFMPIYHEYGEHMCSVSLDKFNKETKEWVKNDFIPKEYMVKFLTDAIKRSLPYYAKDYVPKSDYYSATEILEMFVHQIKKQLGE